MYQSNIILQFKHEYKNPLQVLLIGKEKWTKNHKIASKSSIHNPFHSTPSSKS